MEILDKIVKKKEQIQNYTRLASEKKWISPEVFEKISNDLQKDKITIGIVGQMKHGKSTLLNALIFGDNVLPTATTPMTASLSVLTHGETEGIEVEFFSVEEWNSLKEKANSHGKSSEIDSAIELISAAESLSSEIYNLIGTKREINFEEIRDYVGAKGRFTPITKSLKIKHPNSKLRGADFVDTPGFNDPVISREAKTKEFLSKADVVIVILTANRAFDEQDKDIIFNQIRAVGTGRVIILINKYDLALEDGDKGVQEILTDVTKKINHEIADLEKIDPIPAKILSEANPMLFSSLFALIGKLRPDKLDSYSDIKKYYDKFRAEYPQIQTQDDFLNWSKFSDLEKEIERIINKDKFAVLINKPASELIGKIKEYKREIESQIISLELEEKALSKDTKSITDEIDELDQLGVGVDSLMNLKKNKLQEFIVENLIDIPGKLYEAIHNILTFDLNNLPEKGFLEDNKDYIKKCKIVIENKLYSFQDFHIKILNNVKRHIIKAFRNELNEIDIELTKLVKTNVKSEHSIHIEGLKKSFLESLQFESESVDFNLDFSEVYEKGYFKFFGVGKLDIIEIARSEIGGKFTIGYFNDITEMIKQSFSSNISYFADAKQRIVEPIITALTSAKANISMKEERIEEIKATLDELNNSFEELDKNILKIEEQLYAQLNF